MNNQLIPASVLAQADKVLFIGHFALGDFTYLQNYFAAFAQQYPHIKMHIWVDEVRRSWKFWEWRFLKKYALYDWLEACPFFTKVYKKNYSPIGLRQSIREAKAEQYPIIISLAMIRTDEYIRLARTISDDGFVAAMQGHVPWYALRARRAAGLCDVVLPIKKTVLPNQHISDRFALWFERLFGVHVPQKKRFPFIAIPHEWITYAKLLFLKWGIDKQTKHFSRVIFINPFAKNDKRSWPLINVLELVTKLCRKDEYGDVSFVINVVPEEMKRAKAFFSKHSLNNTFLFSAENNFFQLPAVISLCDFTISVETSIMHFASALHVPVIALMRQKHPGWAPIDAEKAFVLTTKTTHGVVADIPVAEVLHALETVKSESVVATEISVASSLSST